MNQRIDVKNEIQQAGGVARQAATSRKMIWLARLGYAVKGIVYVIIGWLAVQLAIGVGGKATDQRGALQTISRQPFGHFLLIIVAIGLLGYALWSFIQAIFDTENAGRNAKGIIKRLAYAAVGISYALLSFGAFRLVTVAGSTAKSTTTTTQDWTPLLLKQPSGVALVVLLGLVVLAIAVSLFMEAYKTHFLRHLKLFSVSATVRQVVTLLGRLGYAAQGVVFVIIGLFLLVAAVQHNPGQAKGLDTALLVLSQQPFGKLLLAIVALGFLAYGIYSWVEARYRLVRGS